jgi:hypothetical protein
MNRLMRVRRISLPSGQDTVQVRREYFRNRRRRVSDLRFAVWAIPFALISWLYIAGFTGLGN